MRAAVCLLVLVGLALPVTAAARRDGDVPARSARTSEDRAVLKTPGTLMVLLRGGHFRMGSTVPELVVAQEMCRLEPLGRECRNVEFANFSNEMVAHEVMLADYWLDRTEVTNEAYRRCVDAGVCEPAPYEAAEAWRAADNLPVTLVSWYDALAYCQWRGARLPSEAEWERAAKGWNQRTFPWGDTYNPKLCNHGQFSFERTDDGDGYAELAPVDAYPQGRTPEGIAGLAGNVEEWVNDWYGPFPDADVVDPAGPSTGEHRVLRGGSFLTGRPWMRGARRSHDTPSSRRPDVGFRCARDYERRIATPDTTVTTPPPSP